MKKFKLNITKTQIKNITKFIFVTTQLCALIWVFTSYGIALYSTLRLGQVYTLAELSEPAIHVILGTSCLKVLENIFEHNNGAIFGTSIINKYEHTGGNKNDGDSGHKGI